MSSSRIEQRSFRLHYAWVLLAVAFWTSSTHEIQAEGTGSPSGVLHMVNGDFVEGRLLPSRDPNTVSWASPAFAEPLSFMRQGVEKIVWERKTHSRPAGPHRVVLRDRRVLYGKLDALSADAVVLVGERHGRVKLRRDEVARIENVGPTSLLVVDSAHGLAGWSSMGIGRRTGEWTWVNGVLRTEQQGADLFFSASGLDHLEVDLEIGSGVPGFMLTLGAGSDVMTLNAGYSVEPWESKLVVHRAAGTEFRHQTLGRLQRAAGAASGGAQYRLRMLLDATRGRLDVYSDGEFVGTFHDPEGGPLPESGGIFLRNGGERLEVRRLRVRRWKGEQETAGARGDTLTLTDGTVSRPPSDEAQLRMAPGSGELVFSTVPKYGVDVSRMDVLRFRPADAPAKEPESHATVGVAYADGTFLEGALVEILEGAFRVRAGFAHEPFLLRFCEAEEVTFVPAVEEPLGDAEAAPVLVQAGLFQGKGVSLHGWVEGELAQSEALPWRPLYSKQVVAATLSDVARVTYPGSHAPPDQQADTEIHFENGDVLGGRVLGADAESVQLELPGGERVAVERARVRAIRFDAVGVGRAFSEKGQWTLTGKGVVEDGVVTLSGNSTAKVRVLDATHSRLRFRLRFDDRVGTVSIMTREIQAPVLLRMLGFGRRRNRQEYGFWLTCDGSSLSAQSVDSMRGMVNNGGLSTPVDGESGVDCELVLRDDRMALEFYAGGKRLASCRRRQRGETGLGEVTFTAMDHQKVRGGRVFFGGRGGVVRLRNGQIMAAGAAGKGGRVRIDDVRASRGLGLEDPLRRERLLTRRRATRATELTHVLVASNGDVLRGQWLGLDEQNAYFRMRLRKLTLPRTRVAEIVALRERSEVEPPRFRVHLVGNRRVSLASLKSDGTDLVGEVTGVGEIRLAPGLVRRFTLAPTRQLRSPYDSWVALPPVPLPAFSCLPGAPSEGEVVAPSPLLGKPAPTFSLADLDGNVVRLEEIEGQIVILDFWATWCGPCVAGMPRLMKVVEKYQDRGVVLLAINQQEEVEAIRPFLERNGWQLRVLRDANAAVAQSYGVRGIPQTVILDKARKVRNVHVGLLPELERVIGDDIEALLGEVPGEG